MAGKNDSYVMLDSSSKKNNSGVIIAVVILIVIVTGIGGWLMFGKKGAPNKAPVPTEQNNNTTTSPIVPATSEIAESVSTPVVQEQSSPVSINEKVVVYFARGEASPLASESGKIRLLSEKLNGAAGKLDIIGHTDTLGTEEFNQQLSQERATTVKSMLISSCDATKIQSSLKGLGEGQPITANGTNVGNAENRRVELTFVGQK